MKIVEHLPIVRGAPTTASPARVTHILDDVRDRGDDALRDWSEQFDKGAPPQWTVPQQVLESAWNSLPQPDRDALDHAIRNIRAFAEAQKLTLQAMEMEIEPGVVIGQRVVPIERVACYVPGGRYPLPSTVLMTVIPALAAGVQHVVVLTPPQQNSWPDKHILAAAYRAGATAVHPVGGVQAIGAAAYGTASIAAVDMIVGPGNAWVTEAKRQVYGIVGIDALAGPSEVMVLCDASAHLQTVAADLLAQAEHDPDAEAIAVTDDRAFAEQLAAEVDRQLALLPTREIAGQAILHHGRIIVVADRAAMVALANERAPEHLEIVTSDAAELAKQCTSFGGLFIGHDAAEVLGDYCAGPSHVLPTGRAGRYTGGLSALTFLKVLSTQQAQTGAAKALAQTAAHLARLEGLEAHARAAELRK
jgi:sulfopropanediol 3-dehydrogenase